MPAKAITADGPVFATVGAIFIAIIPLCSLPKKLPLGTVALWKSLPERNVISQVAEGSVVESLPQPKVNARADFSGHQTMVTRVGAAASPMDCPPELAVGELCLATSSGSRRYRISLEALERGILIGRYERCLNLGEDELRRLSRVHLLISKIGQDVVAIDTASTFGSIRKSGGFESVVLGDQDELLLADVLLVEWKYNRPVQA